MSYDERREPASQPAPEDVHPAADSEIVAATTVERPGRTVLVAVLLGRPVSDRLRDEVVTRARRRVVADVLTVRLETIRRARAMNAAAAPVKAPTSAATTPTARPRERRAARRTTTSARAPDDDGDPPGAAVGRVSIREGAELARGVVRLWRGAP